MTASQLQTFKARFFRLVDTRGMLRELQREARRGARR